MKRDDIYLTAIDIIIRNGYRYILREVGKYSRRLVALAIMLVASFPLFAGSLQVVSLNINVNDLTARTRPVRDKNDNLCALVKVSIPQAECRFEGNVISQSYDINEYLVYMSPNTKFLQIKYPGTETLMIDLTPYVGREGLVSGATYQLSLSGYEQPSGRQDAVGGNYLILDITPKTGAVVKVDGQIQTIENGQTATFLTYGSHSINVEAPGYETYTGTVNISNGGNTNLPIRLQSAMATLNINTGVADARIKINGKERSTTGKFSGQLAPGIYLVEIEKEGHKKYTESVELGKNGHKDLNIDKLEPVYGSINIDYKPIGATILIDGKDYGTTPTVVRDLIVGKHNVTVSKDGYQSYSGSVSINEGTVARLEGTLAQKTSTTSSSTPTTTATVSTTSSSNGKIKVTGKVTDWKGEEMIGATVMQKGTTNGTACDIDGNFTLEVPPDSELQISYVGYKTKTVKVKGKTNLGKIKIY